MEALKGLTSEAIYVSLETGSIKTQAAGLSTEQIFALLGFIAPIGSAQPAPGLERSCKGAATFHPAPDGPAWNGWSTSVTNSRFQDPKAGGLTASDVPNLKLKWALNLGNVAMTRGSLRWWGDACSWPARRGRSTRWTPTQAARNGVFGQTNRCVEA